MNAPKQYMNRASLAHALDISESTVDEMVASLDLPRPHAIEDGEPVWDWDKVEAFILNKPKRGIIYFVGFADYVKIGFTTGPLEFRLPAIQTGAPERLTVYATMEGTFEREREIHKQFRAHRLNGEWFRRSPDITSFMESLK